MLHLLTIATILRLACYALCQNAEGTSGLPNGDVHGTQDRVGFLASVLRSPYEERPPTRQPVAMRASSLMMFGHRAVPHFVGDTGMPQTWTGYSMRYGKRAEREVAGTVYLAPVATISDTVSAMDKRKSAYMRFGKRNALIGIGLPSETMIAATQYRNSARIRFGRR